MHSEGAHKTFAALDRLLEEERQILLSGALHQLHDLHAHKLALIDTLNGLDTPDHGALDALRSKLERNQSLLGSAVQGVRAVVKRLGEVRRVQSQFESYDAAGRRNTVTTHQRRELEKRS